MKYIFLILELLFVQFVYSQIDTATIHFNQYGKDYYVRIGYNTNKVDSTVRVSQVDSSFKSRITKDAYERRSFIVHYYTGVAVVYVSDGGVLKRLPKTFKTWLPIDYYDNARFTNYLAKRVFTN